jgi:hypothetical protein
MKPVTNMAGSTRRKLEDETSYQYGWIDKKAVGR